MEGGSRPHLARGGFATRLSKAAIQKRTQLRTTLVTGPGPVGCCCEGAGPPERSLPPPRGLSWVPAQRVLRGPLCRVSDRPLPSELCFHLTGAM